MIVRNDLHFVPQHILPERLAFLPIRNEVIEHARHCHRREPRGHRLHGQPESHDAVFVVAAAEEHLVVRQFAPLDLARVAIESEIADPVMAAGIGAATRLNRKAAHLRIVVAADGFGQRGTQVHGLGEPQVAGVCARASDDVGYLERACLPSPTALSAACTRSRRSSGMYPSTKCS